MRKIGGIAAVKGENKNFDVNRLNVMWVLDFQVEMLNIQLEL